MTDPAELEGELARRADTAWSLQELAEVERDFLGKRSQLALAHQRLGALDPDERKREGKALHDLRLRLESIVSSRRAALELSERAARLEADRLDLTEVIDGSRPGHLHLVTRTREALEDVFLGMGYEVAEGPEAETDWYNFEALNMPPDHPARRLWDTFYLELGEPGTVLLRTHTSPMQIHLLETRPLPIYAVIPGRCYRRDTPDASHLPVFHQIEALVVDRGITFGDLAGTIETFTSAYFGAGIHSRLRPSYFPFTEPSAELDITCTICRGEGCRTCSQTGFLELGGCGMVHPAVFEAVGVDPEEWSGFAFGFGVDRLAQMRYGVSDLRTFVENDIRFLTQI